MTFLRTTLLAGAAVLMASASMASAADLNGGYGGSMKDGPYMPAIATQPSWYARLDVGISAFDQPSMTENGIYTLTETYIDRTWGIGGGIGRYFTSNVRGDITYDHRFEAAATGRLDTPGAPLEGRRRFGLTSDLVMANLYYDFDMGGRFRPYIGVGLGAVHHKTSVGTVTGCGCTTGVIGEGSNWDVAGAFMTGFSMQVRDRMHFDAGYRFLYMGQATTGEVTATANGNDVVSKDPDVREIHSHEIRVGLRYDIN